MNFIQFTDELKRFDFSRIVFVGLGNEARGDDSAGIIFLNKLREKNKFRSAKFINAGRNPENYLQMILNCDPELVVFIDAADWKGKPGEIKWLESGEIDQMKISTHNFSIKIIELYLSSFKRREFLYLGIQPLSMSYGKHLSEQLKLSLSNFFNDAS